MIKDAIKFLMDCEKKSTIEIDGKNYNVKLDNTLIPMETVDKIHIDQVSTLETHTLTSILDYLVLNPDKLDLKKMYIHIKDYNEVELSSTITGDYREKEIYIRSKSIVPEKRFNQFMDIETFLIMLNSTFLLTPDLENIIKIISKVVDNKVVNFEDDGISQKVNIKSGIELVQETKLPRLNILKPFRTFLEAEQPETTFLLRARKGVDELQYALFEADGGAWRNISILNIKAYLLSELETHKITLPVLS